VVRFIQRSSRNSYKTPVVPEIVAAGSFGDVRPDTVGASDNLLANRVTGKAVPTKNDLPNFVRKLFGQFVNPKSFKICPIHGSWSFRGSQLKLPTLGN
jgi:hypothetical protein